MSLVGGFVLSIVVINYKLAVCGYQLQVSSYQSSSLVNFYNNPL